VRSGWLRSRLEEARRLDLALYRAVAQARMPVLDATLPRLSRAADYSRLSIGASLVLATAGGPSGRHAAVRGMTSVAVTATVVNVAFKPLLRRRRPERDRSVVGARRRVRMPRSRSFPSGHTAAAFAFATGARHALPSAGPPLFALAALVGFSRVHTGVHYPLDVITGALCGVALGELTNARIDRAAAHDQALPTSDRPGP